MISEIDVRRCIAKKIYAGELVFEFEGDDELVDIPYVKFSSPVKASLRYEIYEDDSVDVTGSIAFTLKGLCSRCLAETEQNFSGEVNACFVPNGGDGEEYGYTQGKIDLTEALRDAVMYAMPQRLVCENACNLPEWE